MVVERKAVPSSGCSGDEVLILWESVSVESCKPGKDTGRPEC